MCGRYTLNASPKDVGVHYGTAWKLDFSPRFNIAPSTDCPIVRLNHDRKELLLSHWGLVPGWVKGEVTVKPINAKAETVSSKPYFRNACKSQRCLVPATGYYEWKGEKGNKQPYFIRPVGATLFSFAGLWECREDGDEILESFTIITTGANEQLSDIHPRMPVIVNERDYSGWLMKGDTRLLRPSEDEFECYPVSKRVNKPGNEGRELIAPVEENQ